MITLTIKHFTLGNYGEGFNSYAYTLERGWLSVNGDVSEIVDIRWAVSNPAVLHALNLKYGI